MIKYLARKKQNYWFRRKISGFGEVLLSLRTKSYNVAIIRHAYIDYKVKQLIFKGIFETMNVQEIRQIIEKYKTYMREEEYNDYEEIRDNELTIELDGQKYGGHTKEALLHAINRYKSIHAQNDLELVKEETAKILKRSNFTQEDLDKLETDNDKKIFHWELLKAEWELLQNAYDGQKEIIHEVQEETSQETINAIYQYQEILNSQQPIQQEKRISISELLQMYIKENQSTKDWSDKNGRDLQYVLGHLASYYDDKDINELRREHFSQFRDNVLRNLPRSSQKKELQGKSTIELIKIVKNQNLAKIGLTTINKHLRRVHQVFEWANRCDYVKKNLTKDLELRDKKKSKKQKTAKLPYTEKELQKLFNSPWFNEDIKVTLKYKPQNIFIPLLALFTGAKPTELGILKLSAIKKKNGVVGIDFNQMVKTTDSERFTPLSQTLIDMGFLKYVLYQKKQKEELLFPRIKIYKGGGVNFTNDFTVYNRKYITTDKEKTFYSIRHLVIQMLKNKKVPIYIRNDIVGHSQTQGEKGEEVYGDEFMPEEILRDTINECLHYDYLDFTNIKVAINNIF